MARFLLSNRCRHGTAAGLDAGNNVKRKEIYMKRIVTVCIIGLVALGAVSAQGFGPRTGIPNQPGQAQIQQVASTIEGKLALVQGHPAVTVKDKTYFVQIPQFMYGFVDGLKEGATVKLEGFEVAIPYAPNSFLFRVNTLTIGAKSYDLSQIAGGRMGQRGGMMGGRSGQGGSYGMYQGSRW